MIANGQGRPTLVRRPKARVRLLSGRPQSRILTLQGLGSRKGHGIGYSKRWRRMNLSADVTREDTLALVHRCGAGDADAYNQLFEAIYQDLRRRAHQQLAGCGNATMSTTLLVHETYLKLAGAQLALNDRAHFFAIAARAMRQILINAARDRCAQKRGGNQRQVTFDQEALATPELAQDIIGLDAAMDALADSDARLARVVELHFFAGLGFAEISELLDRSERTVARDWRAARALLRMHMEAPQ